MARLLTLILFFSTISCQSTYHLVYNSYLKQSKNKTLEYKDEYFNFTFKTLPNGIIFNITNKLDSIAYVVWEESYFITPNGNSYKALNSDLLNTNTVLNEKDNNISIIPPHSTFTRFTSSKNNVEQFTKYYSNIIITQYKLRTSKEIFLSKNTFFTISDYRKRVIISKNSKEILKYKFERLADYLLNNNNLALGLAIKMGKKIYHYKFDFKIKNVEIYKKEGKIYKLIGVASEPYFNL